MRIGKRAYADIWVCHLGLVCYRDALGIQEQLRARRQADEIPDTLLLLEHPPVYTLGRRSGAEDLPLGEDFYRAKGLDVIATDRGGKVTYHGPGQLVGYPIMRIHDVHQYLRTMEDAIIHALAGARVHARSRHVEGIDYTGVWVAERKIASIGVHVSRSVTTHGFAVNVDNDLAPFSWVISCGLPEVRMTSIAAELAGANSRPTEYQSAACRSSATSSAPGVPCFRKRMAYSFAQVHGLRQRLVSPHRLGIDTANPSTLAERASIRTIQPAPPVVGTSLEAVTA